MADKHTPGPWQVEQCVRMGEVRDYFVSAPDVNGFAYKAEILGDDEYREESLDRKLADCHLIAAAPELLEALEALALFSKPTKSNAAALNYAHQVIAKARGDQ